MPCDRICRLIFTHHADSSTHEPTTPQVIVDDRLPVDRRGELLCACSKDRAELWVSILEKVRWGG